MSWSKAYCPKCDLVIPMAAIEAHGTARHEEEWLSLSWSSPLEFPVTRETDIAQQLDAAADHL
jgi:hypothetical protein